MSSSSKVTRSKCVFPVFKSAKALSDSVLPSYEDVMRYYFLLQHSIKRDRRDQDPSIKEISELGVKRVALVWQKASIPIVSHTRILQKLKQYHDKYQGLMKSYKERQHTETCKQKMKRFADEAKQLFDIAACKCEFSKCTCEKANRVPPEERPFLVDQRTSRLMYIGSIDIPKTNRLKRKRERKERTEARRLVSGNQCASVSTLSTEHCESSIDSVTMSDSDTDVNNREHKVICPGLAASSNPRMTNAQNRLSLSRLAGTADRYGISDRAAAALASSVLEDVGLVQSKDMSRVVDKNKIRRQRIKTRNVLGQKSQVVLVQGLYFDGRKDKTLVSVKEGETYHRRTITEEHYVLEQQPESDYLGHISPKSGSAVNITSAIMEFLAIRSINKDDLVAIGCDGTAVNTGCKGGSIRLLEQKLNRPLQWFVCQLHSNELLLRHLFVHVDGGQTTGPNSFSGTIGRQLETCEQQTVKKFNPIQTTLPDIDSDDLSTDQKYLLNICKAVQSGHCSESLANTVPGKMSHARWLTTANRIIRLYISTSQPSDELTLLAEYVVKVYARIWFAIKTKPSCMYGALHVWEMISFSRYLPYPLRSVIDPIMQRNAFFAHPENLLLCMLVDDRQHIRQLGLRRVLKARESTLSSRRQFQVPAINFAALDYIDLIDWTCCTVTVPPILSQLTVAELQCLISGKNSHVINIEKFPCHTQGVERFVKLVTEAAGAVCGPEARDGYIRSRIQARGLMPKFETKQHYRTVRE